MFTEQKQLFHWRRAKTNKHEVAYCTRLLVGGMLLVSAIGGSVQAGPTGEVVTNGAATFTRPDADTTNIGQTSNRVDINWQSFDTSTIETVNFNQPGSSSVAINRISGSRTQFNGTLNANGQIFLINQNGITFGNGAAVNVGSLLATTSLMEGDLQDEAVSQLAENSYSFSNPGIDAGQSIVVDEGARITIGSPGGFAVLAAPNVTNNGIIENGPGAPMVRIVLASAGEFTLNTSADLRGDGLITYAVSPELFDGGEGNGVTGVTNNGTLQARSGSIYVSANLASNIVSGVVNLNGIVDADQFVATPGDGVMAVANVPEGSYQGGNIRVVSVGDINIGGGADIHAIGGDGVEADFLAADNINMGTDGSPAKITLKAIDDGVGHVRTRRGNGDDVDADLTMRAGTDGSGSLTINGDIEVMAENTASGQGSYAGADAEATLTAANDVTITTGNETIRVAAVSDTAIGSYADADTDIDIRAGLGSVDGGDLSITGNIEVTATGVSASGEAQGEVEADLSGDNVTINGDVTVAGTGTSTGANGSDALASAELDIEANDGDLSITGKTEVTATAMTTRGNTEEIDADVELSGDKVTIIGDVTVAATGTASSNDGSSTADLDIEANDGDLNITGDIAVMAKSSVENSELNGTRADTELGLTGRSVLIDGNVTVVADASVGGDEIVGTAKAGSNLDISTSGEEGDLAVTGDIVVDAKAVRSGSYSQDADAEAVANLSAGRNISLANVTVESTATNEGGNSEKADANSDLQIYAGNSGTGDLEINGDVTVRSTASLGTGGSNVASAAASAELYAANNVTLRGNTIVEANASHTGTEFNGKANANLTVDAGDEGGATGNLDIEGDIDVLANASTVSSDNIRGGDAHANAIARLSANDNVTINGDTSVIAKSAVDTAVPDEADALASLTVVAGTRFDEGRIEAAAPSEGDGQFDSGTPGDLSISGDITVQADASTNGSGAAADANAVLLATGDMNVTGDIDVDASAKATSDNGAGDTEGTGNTDANAALLMFSGIRINVDGGEGDLADGIAGLAEELIKSGEPGEIFGEFGFGFDGEGDISLTGDINVAASADLNVTGGGSGYGGSSGDSSGYGSGGMVSGYSEATAAALILGGGDVTIDTDPVTVSSEANANYETTGSGYGSGYVDTEAVSVLMVAAGLNGIDEEEGGGSYGAGDLNIRGDMIAKAKQSATVDGVENSEQNDELAVAINALFASGDLTIRGADPLANADNQAVVQQRSTAYQICANGSCDPVTGGLPEYDGTIIPGNNGDDEAGFHQYAQLIIEAGGTVSIESVEPQLRRTPAIVNVLTAYQSPEPVGPGWPGARPMHIDSQGNMHVATGVGATRPPQVVAMDINLEEALLSGGDPSALLPPTAATGCVAAGNDAYSITAPDFFDQVVAGSCATER